MNVPNFTEAVEKGEIVNKDGYHQPDNYNRYQKGCGCMNTTKKGAYRDVSVQMPDGKIVHFYHQTPVVVEENGRYLLNSGGYRTSTTKERINRYIPFRVYQSDFEWYVEKDDLTIEFEDHMQIEA